MKFSIVLLSVVDAFLSQSNLWRKIILKKSVEIENEEWNEGEVPWFPILSKNKKILVPVPEIEEPIWDAGEISWTDLLDKLESHIEHCSKSSSSRV
jgi:hypothetical protein